MESVKVQPIYWLGFVNTWKKFISVSRMGCGGSACPPGDTEIKNLSLMEVALPEAESSQCDDLRDARFLVLYHRQMD